MDKEYVYYWSAWLLILIASMLALVHYDIHLKNSCTSEPLEYYVKITKDAYGRDSNVTGTVIINRYSRTLLIPFGDIENKTVEVTFSNDVYIPLEFNLSLK